MITNFIDDKNGPKYEVGQPVKIFDADEQKVIKGVVTEVGEETIEIKWEDLREPSEYERSRITLKGEYIIEH